MFPISRPASTQMLSRFCNVITLGIVINGFKRTGDCFSRPSAAEVHDSISRMYRILTDIKHHNWREPANRNEEDHVTCDLTVDLKKRLGEVLGDIPSSVQIFTSCTWISSGQSEEQRHESCLLSILIKHDSNINSKKCCGHNWALSKLLATFIPIVFLGLSNASLGLRASAQRGNNRKCRSEIKCPGPIVDNCEPDN